MILFYCSAMESLAKSIAQLSADIRAGAPTLPLNEVRLGKIDWDFFPNGDPRLFIENVGSDVENQDVAFLAHFKRESAIDQLLIIYELPRYGAKSFKIILPYFPGTMDRMEQKGDVVTAKTFAQMLSAVEWDRVPLFTYDIHSLEIREYFRHPIVPRLETAIGGWKLRITSQENVAICFPDAGALKRFGAEFKNYDKVLCHKERLGDKRKVKIIEGNPKNKNVLIVDDLVMTGGTLLECAGALRRRGAKSVSAYATHAVFPNKSYYNMSKFPFANFWITDSCPETIKAMETVSPITKFEVLSLAPSIAKILLS